MKYKTSDLDGVLLDLAFAISTGPWFGNAPPVIVDGVCRVFDDRCGWPGVCPAWEIFSTSDLTELPYKENGAIGKVRREPLHWSGGLGEPLKQAIRCYIASKLGDEVELSDKQTGQIQKAARDEPTPKTAPAFGSPEEFSTRDDPHCKDGRKACIDCLMRGECLIDDAPVKHNSQQTEWT